MVEGGSRPERGCEREWLAEAWEQRAGAAGRGQPQTASQVGWGRRRRQWVETDLQGETVKKNKK